VANRVGSIYDAFSEASERKSFDSRRTLRTADRQKES
jgi:hypothetical protein